MWREVEAALRREKLRGKVTTNRGLVCVKTGMDEIVSIVAKVSYQAELTIQPGHASIGLSDPDVLWKALESSGSRTMGDSARRPALLQRSLLRQFGLQFALGRMALQCFRGCALGLREVPRGRCLRRRAGAHPP